ncbi:MAG: GNAT family N-acetyltransferase [Anaerolineae bacterium]
MHFPDRIFPASITLPFEKEGQFIGLTLGEIRPDGASAEMLSLFVAREHRRRGVGTTLLAHLEKALTRMGCRYVDLVYRSDWPCVAAIERLLHRRGWASPQTRALIGKTDRERMAEALRLHQFRLPDGFAIFPWSEITPQERQEIQQRQETEQWYPPVLAPFQEEDRIEPLNSLGLRYQGRVVGWMITHRTAPDTIQYTSLFVQKEFQSLGRAIPLLMESIRRQVSSEVPYAIFMVDVENDPTVKLVYRRMRPYLISLTESRTSRKMLTGSNA